MHPTIAIIVIGKNRKRANLFNPVSLMCLGKWSSLKLQLLDIS